MISLSAVGLFTAPNLPKTSFNSFPCVRPAHLALHLRLHLGRSVQMPLQLEADSLGNLLAKLLARNQLSRNQSSESGLREIRIANLGLQAIPLACPVDGVASSLWNLHCGFYSLASTPLLLHRVASLPKRQTHI